MTFRSFMDQALEEARAAAAPMPLAAPVIRMRRSAMKPPPLAFP